MVEELKPCPFCGGEPRLYSISLPMSADCDDIQVICSECDTMGPSILFDQTEHGETDIPDLEAEAIAAWNCRTPTPDGTGSGEIDAEVERIMAMTDDEIMSTASADDVAWARGFKIGLRSGQDIAAASTPKRDEEQAGEVHPIDAATEAFNAFMDDAVSKAPEPLRKLGEYLSRLLDEDQWKTAEQYLNAAALAAAHKGQS